VSGAAGLTRLHASALDTLRGWVAPDDDQDEWRRTYVRHLLDHDDGMLVTCRPAHLTASALVLDAAGERVLLTHHRKGGFWAQLGGHVEEEDRSLADAALREGREESGVEGLRLLGDGPVDLDAHELSSAFGRCGTHLDVRYAAVAPPGAEPVVSAESHDVRWFPVDALPPGVVADIGRLVDRAVLAQTGASSASVRPESVSLSSESTSSASSSTTSSASSRRPSSAVADTPSR
jgi:8-oxo-dGTP pyrophosphatase MutT (NUDIX family)